MDELGPRFPVKAALGSRVWTPDGAVSGQLRTLGPMHPSRLHVQNDLGDSNLQSGGAGRAWGWRQVNRALKVPAGPWNWELALSPPLLLLFKPRTLPGNIQGSPQGTGTILICYDCLLDRQTSWAWGNGQRTRPRPSKFLNTQAFLCGLHLLHFLTFLPLSPAWSHQALPFLPLTSSQVTVPSVPSDALASLPALACGKDTVFFSLFPAPSLPHCSSREHFLRCSLLDAFFCVPFQVWFLPSEFPSTALYPQFSFLNPHWTEISENVKTFLC